MSHHVAWRQLAREPLVHFLLIGAFLFGLYAVVGRDRDGVRAEILVGQGELAWLTETWTRQWRRPPTDRELRGLIDGYVREEVLYREAMAMGLDRDDMIVRRRMVQKMEFLSEDLSGDTAPSEAELRRHFAAQAERYRLPPRVTFTHVYFSADRRGAAARDATQLLAELRRASRPPDRAFERGDRFLLQYDYADRAPEEIGQLFGRAFADSLFALPPADGWQGPVPSSFGAHLVRVSGRRAGRLPAFEEVVDQVRTDYEHERRRRADAELYEDLRRRYAVRVDSAALRRVTPGAAAP